MTVSRSDYDNLKTILSIHVDKIKRLESVNAKLLAALQGIRASFREYANTPIEASECLAAVVNIAVIAIRAALPEEEEL